MATTSTSLGHDHGDETFPSSEVLTPPQLCNTIHIHPSTTTTTALKPTSTFGSAPKPDPSALLAAGLAGTRRRRFTHSDASNLSSPAASSASAWASSANAANVAFRGGGSPTPPLTPERGCAVGAGTLLPRHSSLHAAKGAYVAGSRPRASSSPPPSRDRDVLGPAAAGAEMVGGSGMGSSSSAASAAHRPASLRAYGVAGEGGTVPFTTLDRQMLTSHPPVQPEVDEKQRADVLRASALAMARQMYELQQQRQIQEQQNATNAAFRAHRRSASATYPSQSQTAAVLASIDERQRSLGEDDILPYGCTNLQEAAYRMAQERLARVQEEHQKQRRPSLFQEHPQVIPSPPLRSRFGSLRAKLTRKRASSDGALLLDDWLRAEHVRRQVSQHQLGGPGRATGVSDFEVDEVELAREREVVLEAAKRSVRAQMRQLDDQVQTQVVEEGKGKLHKEEASRYWGRRGRRDVWVGDLAEQQKKVDLGGGKVMDWDEVGKIAAKRVQPIIDEIEERVEKEREKRAAEERDRVKKWEEKEGRKAREREVKENFERLKKQQKDHERAQIAALEEEKIRNDEASETEGQEQPEVSTSQHNDEPTSPPHAETTSTSNQPPTRTASHHSRALSVSFLKRQSRPRSLFVKEDFAELSAAPDTVAAHGSPSQRLRAWFRSKFPRKRASVSSLSSLRDRVCGTGKDGGDKKDDVSIAGSQGSIKEDSQQRGFIGGIALARLREREGNAGREGLGAEVELGHSNEGTHVLSTPPRLLQAGVQTASPIGQDQADAVDVRNQQPASSVEPTEAGQQTNENEDDSEDESFVLAPTSPIPEDPNPSINAPAPSTMTAPKPQQSPHPGTPSPRASPSPSVDLAARLTPVTARRRALASLSTSGRNSPFRESRFSEIIDDSD